MKKSLILVLFLSSMTFANAQNLEIFSDPVTSQPNSTFDVPVLVRNFNRMFSVTGSMHWDTAVVRLDSISNFPQFFGNSFDSSAFQLGAVANGLMTINWTSLNRIGDNLADSSQFFRLHFSVTKNGGCAVFDFDSIPTDLKWSNGFAQNGPIDATDIQIMACDPGSVPTGKFGYTSSGFMRTFADSSAGGTSWHWEFGDGTTDSVQNPSHTYASANMYNVCLIVTNCCGSDTICKMINVNPSSLNDFLDSDVNIFPNPTTDLVQIKYSSNSSYNLSLLDMTGKVILVKANIQGYSVLNLDKFKNGLYLLRISNENGTIIKQIIKQ